MSRAVLGNERGGDGGAGAERCSPGSGSVPPAVLGSLLPPGLRRPQELGGSLGGGGVRRGRVMLCFQVGAGRGRRADILLIYVNR